MLHYKIQEVTTTFNLRVTWNGKWNWEVKIPPTYADQICGLCGRYDGIRKNDMVSKDGKEVG